jgi:acetyl-CoA carboxylase carboxyl transferase subunit alpha
MTELEQKIAELKSLAEQAKLDISEELTRLSAKLAQGEQPAGEMTAWQRVEMARHPERPTTLDYLARIADQFVELHGDRLFGDDQAMVCGIARIGGIAFTVLGHQKGKNMKENMRRNYGWAHPEGYRKALRLAKQAEKFHRPIVTFIDTAGAYPGLASEERGIGEAIARNIKEFSVLNTVVICIVVGEGGSGGALGIGVGDRVFMLENSTYSVISPEGCASLLYRDTKMASTAATNMKMTATDLKALGIIDAVIPEPAGGAHTDYDLMAARVKEAILAAYKELSAKRPDILLKERSKRILDYGMFKDESDQAGRRESFFKRFFNWGSN